MAQALLTGVFLGLTGLATTAFFGLRGTDISRHISYGIFSTLIGKPAVMKTATRLGLPRKDLMYLVLKLLAGLYDSRDGDWADRIVRSLTRLAPSV